jgi:saccharopine dehydrogenase-like NADP-dependent oxidoreductase
MARLLQTTNDAAALRAAVTERAKLAGEERQRILMGMGWLGLFSDAPVPAHSTVLDGLAKTLEAHMTYQQGERDMVMLQHKFEVELADGRRVPPRHAPPLVLACSLIRDVREDSNCARRRCSSMVSRCRG